MRRGTALALGLVACLVALPQSASARPRGLPGLLGVITSPIGALLGAGRHHRGHHVAHHTPRRSSRGVASRRLPADAAAATAAVPAAGVAAAAVTEGASEPAHPTQPPMSAPKAAANDDQPAKPAVASSNEPVSTQAAAAHAEAPAAPASAQQTSARPVAVTEPAPAPTPAQRNAALTLQDNELRSSIRQGTQDPRPAPATSGLGLSGPLTWPTAFEDVIGYTLWPDRYSPKLRSHGIADILGSTFVAPATLASKAGLKGAQAKADGGAIAADPCSTTTSSSKWPAAEIERTIVDLSAEQRQALDQLETAVGHAAASIASACRQTANLNPVERLHSMQSTLWAVHDAAMLIREPLAAFYDSLTDEQKKRFNASAADNRESRDMNRGDMARVCGMPASLEQSTRQIDHSLQTNKTQRSSLEALNKKSFEMGQFLMASCLKAVPSTPAERLDNAADRLTAVLFAASNLAPSVNDFYAQLNDGQKTKLKTLR